MSVCFLRRDKKVVDGDGRKGRGVGRRHYKKDIFHEKKISITRKTERKIRDCLKGLCNLLSISRTGKYSRNIYLSCDRIFPELTEVCPNVYKALELSNINAFVY